MRNNLWGNSGICSLREPGTITRILIYCQRCWMPLGLVMSKSSEIRVEVPVSDSGYFINHIGRRQFPWRLIKYSEASNIYHTIRPWLVFGGFWNSLLMDFTNESYYQVFFKLVELSLKWHPFFFFFNKKTRTLEEKEKSDSGGGLIAPEGAFQP